ncbi:MAG: hypothetical protein H8D34_27610 [Chloroflexi bacterium]|nr:hypothetical protein [Chloroflexota bacterium]
MGKVAIVENGSVVYRGSLPKAWKNTSGLVHATTASLIEKGILPLEEVTPEHDSATHKVDGYTDDIQENKVVMTWTVREKTQGELDAETEAKANEYIHLRAVAHIPVPDQLDMIYWDKKNNTTDWIEYVDAIKEKIPK